MDGWVLLSFEVLKKMNTPSPSNADARGVFGNKPSNDPQLVSSPPKSHKESKHKSVWQRYRGLIIVLIVLFVVFVVVVVVMIVRRKKAGPSLPPGVKMTQSHAEDFSDKLQQFKDASEDIRKEMSDTHPDPKPMVVHHHQ